MRADALFACDPGEPLGLSSRPDPVQAGSLSGAHALRFELSSRGDRVPGRLLLPGAAAEPHPVVLVQHGIGGSKNAPYLDAVVGPWLAGGVAVAGIDFPLHGERADAKLARRLASALEDPDTASGELAALLVETMRQAVIDLRRTLDALETLPFVDAKRVAYAGFSLGAIAGSILCGVDARPRAAALALGGGGIGPAEIDPVHYLGGFAPRPLLLVNATRDATVPRSATEALFAAAGEPKEILWVDAPHHELPGVALKAMWQFLRRELGV